MKDIDEHTEDSSEGNSAEKRYKGSVDHVEN